MPMLIARRSLSTAIIRVLSVIVAVAAVACGQKTSPALPTVPGPEADNLISRVSGYIVMSRAPRGLVALSLPDGRETVLRKGSAEQGSVHAVTGPDLAGRIVYVEGHAKFFRLKAMRISGGGDALIFERSGDVAKKAIGAPALAPQGGLIAFVADAKPDYSDAAVGPLEIWDLATERGKTTEVTAIDAGLSWFADGRRLAFVELVPDADAQALTRDASDFDVIFKSRDRIGTPVISILDLATGARTRVHVGAQPRVSPDGRSLLIEDASRRWWSLDLASGHATRGEWPGNWRGPIAWAADDLLLYWGHPTVGTPVSYTEGGSPLVARQAMGDIKLSVPGTGRFQTVVRGIDPRTRLSFGNVAKRF